MKMVGVAFAEGKALQGWRVIGLTKSPGVTGAPVAPLAATASTAVNPTVSKTDCPAFNVAETLSVATDAFCRFTERHQKWFAAKVF